MSAKAAEEVFEFAEEMMWSLAFQFNNQTTRNNLIRLIYEYVVEYVTPIPDAYAVICDHTNNPPSVVNANQLRCHVKLIFGSQTYQRDLVIP